jgi:hypothetical protein
MHVSWYFWAVFLFVLELELKPLLLKLCLRYGLWTEVVRSFEGFFFLLYASRLDPTLTPARFCFCFEFLMAVVSMMASFPI